MKTAVFYAVGKSKKKLMAYDEYDSVGSGIYFTDDLMMIDRFHLSGAEERISQDKYKNLNIYFVEIDDFENEKGKKVKIELFYSPKYKKIN